MEKIYSFLQKQFSTYLSFALLGGIIFIAFYNFFHFRSLWLDEAMLALNISEKSAVELLQPLDLNQVAPIGFLLLEKVITSIIGNTDWSLRIFPFIAYIAALYFYFQWHKRMVDDKFQAIISTIFLASTPIILYYSSEVKQYASDILCTILLYYCANHLLKTEKIDKQFIIISSIAIWFSNITIIPLTTIAFASIINQFVNRQINFKVLFLNFLPAFTSFGIYYFLFIKGHPSKDIMQTYWSNENAFLTGSLLSSDFWFNLSNKFNELLSLTSFNYIWLSKSLFVIGIISMILHKKWTLVILTLIPVLLHLTLSYFNLYPFSKRLIIYLIPLVLFSWTYGIFSVLSLLKSKRQIIYLSPLLVLYYPARELKNILPFEKEEIKPCLIHLNEHFETGDSVYVYYGAQPAFSYYTKVQPVIEIKRLNTILGKEYRMDRTKYQDDFEGSNYNWILFSHPYWKEIDGLNEQEYIVQLAKSNGYTIIDEFHQKGASLYHVEKN